MNTKAIAKAAFVAALAVFALVSCNKNRHKPGPEVPDEPVVPEEKERMERLVMEEMQGAFALRVPLVADAGWGDNWLEAH